MAEVRNAPKRRMRLRPRVWFSESKVTLFTRIERINIARMVALMMSVSVRHDIHSFDNNLRTYNGFMHEI